jgi:GT2 family glycosyltransferase
MDDTPGLPLVTVAIPTYNRLPLLREAVASVAAQTYPRWELMVSDDGSTDGTVEWVRGLGDERVSVVRAPHTGHIGAVRNRGVAAGTGELVGFLDSDDLWFPHTLETMVAALRGSAASWVYGDTELMNEAGETIPMFARGLPPVSGWVVREVLAAEVGVNLGALLVRRELFERVGRFSEDPRLLYRGDHELAVRLAQHGRAAALQQVLMRVREHRGRTTAQLTDLSERTALVYDHFLQGRPAGELARLARRLRAGHLAVAGARRLAQGEYAAGAMLLARSFADHPLSRRWVGGVLRGIRGRLRRGAPAQVATPRTGA